MSRGVHEGTVDRPCARCGVIMPHAEVRIVNGPRMGETVVYPEHEHQAPCGLPCLYPQSGPAVPRHRSNESCEQCRAQSNEKAQ